VVVSRLRGRLFDLASHDSKEFGALSFYGALRSQLYALDSNFFLYSLNRSDKISGGKSEPGFVAKF